MLLPASSLAVGKSQSRRISPVSLTFLQPVTVPRQEAGPGEPKVGAVPLTQAQAWAPQPCSPPPQHLSGAWQRAASPPRSCHASVSRSVLSRQSLAEEVLVFYCLRISHSSPWAGRTLAPAPVWSWPDQYLHQLGEESIPKCPKEAQRTQARGWPRMALAAQSPVHPKPRTPSHSIPSQRLCDPKAPAKSKYFPVSQCRAQRGYREQLCQTDLTSFVVGILSLVEKKYKLICFL